MKRRTMFAVILGLLLLPGCDVYWTYEGIGFLGPNGGWFFCSDNNDCAGYIP